MNNVLLDPFQSPAVISFCTGIRGLERGVEQAIGKLSVAVYVENESWLIANLLAGMESGVLDPSVIWPDAKTWNPKPFRNQIHGFLAGWPCTPFSLAGKRGGEDDPRHLWPSIRNAAEAIKPVWIFGENVDDHLSMGFDTVYKDLHDLGYAVEAGVYTAEEVGAPHERKRLFILALANSYKMAAIGRYDDIRAAGCTYERKTQGQNGQRSGNEFGTGRKERLGGNISGALEKNTGRIGQSVLGEGKQAGQGNEPENSTSQLGNSRHVGSHKHEKQTTGNKQSGKKLAHSDRPGCEEFRNNGITPKKSDAGAGDAGNNEELVNTDGLGLKGYNSNAGESYKKTGGIEEGSIINGANRTSQSRYPAGQGAFQYDWEEPRTLKSGVGFTIARYNFREDILRAAGNSVVADCAEIAFLELLQKHLK